MVAKGILLVGGKGTRLAPLTNDTPKPMLKVAGRPVTEHQIIKAKQAGINHLVLATSYLAEVFEPYFGDGSKFGLKITYAVEDVPLGTGGAIANAAKELEIDKGESIVIFNGDVISAHDLRAQIELHESKSADATLYLTRVKDARAYGCVPIDADQRVQAFLEKMENPITDTINAGCYIFRDSALENIPQNEVVSVERDTFPKLLDSGAALYGYLDENYWIDMGTPQSFIKASQDLLLNPHLSGAVGNAKTEYLIGKGTQISPSAEVGGGSTIGDNCNIGDNVVVMGSMLADGVTVGPGAKIIDSYVAAGQFINAEMNIVGQIIGN